MCTIANSVYIYIHIYIYIYIYIYVYIYRERDESNMDITDFYFISFHHDNCIEKYLTDHK
jgi:hypothetical protein